VTKSWVLGTHPNLEPMLISVPGAYSKRHMLMGLSGFSLALFTRVKQWSRARIEMLLFQVRNEIKDKEIHASWPM
jgi:hypothetical protein